MVALRLSKHLRATRGGNTETERGASERRNDRARKKESKSEREKEKPPLSDQKKESSSGCTEASQGPTLAQGRRRRDIKQPFTRSHRRAAGVVCVHLTHAQRVRQARNMGRGEEGGIFSVGSHSA